MNQEETGRLLDLEPQLMSGFQGIEKRVVFGPDRFWSDYVLRCFTLQPGAEVPVHSHPWPHYILVLQGKLELRRTERTYLLEELGWAYVPSDRKHGFRQQGSEPAVFICIVPKEGDVAPGQASSE